MSPQPGCTPVAPNAAGDSDVLPALLQLKKGRIECSALVTAVAGGRVRVLLAIVLPESTWASHNRWQAGDKAALLFAHLVPAVLPREGVDEAAGAAGSSPAQQQHGQQQPLTYVEQLRRELETEGVQQAGTDAEVFRCGLAWQPACV